MTGTEDVLRKLDAPAEWAPTIDAALAQAPPLTPDQRRKLRNALHGKASRRAVAA